jgi:hypothetical protein
MPVALLIRRERELKHQHTEKLQPKLEASTAADQQTYRFLYETWSLRQQMLWHSRSMASLGIIAMLLGLTGVFCLGIWVLHHPIETKLSPEPSSSNPHP